MARVDVLFVQVWVASLVKVNLCGLLGLRFHGARPARPRPEHRRPGRTSHPIQNADLRAGDFLINPAPDLAGHVVIFDHWVDTTMTSYVGYEQSGDGGTHHRTIPYPTTR
jgi:hypothetical protein